MAYNVNFLRGTSQSFADLAVKSKNTFYYIDEKDLYIGDIKLTNGEDLAAAVIDIAKNKGDIDIIKAQLDDLTGNGGGSGDSSITDLLSELNAKVGANERAIQAETERATAAEGQLTTSIGQVAADLALLTQTVNNNETDIENKVSALDERLATAEEAVASNSSLVTSAMSKLQEQTTTISVMQGDISDLETLTDLLVGADANKSIRAIAIEVLAEQLLADGLTENFASLQELAAWLADHPEEAAEMNVAIQQNTAAIQALSGTVTGHGTVIEGLLKSLEEIQAEETGVLALAQKYTDEKVAIVTGSLNEYITNNDSAVEALEGKIEAINNPETGLLAQAQEKIKELQNTLGTAAYKAVEDFEAAGSAAAALAEAKAYTDAALTWGQI